MTQPTQEQREALRRKRSWMEVSVSGVEPEYEGGDTQMARDMSELVHLALAQNPADGAEAVDAEWLESVGASFFKYRLDSASWHLKNGEVAFKFYRRFCSWIAEVDGITMPANMRNRAQVRHLLAAFNQGRE